MDPSDPQKSRTPYLDELFRALMPMSFAEWQQKTAPRPSETQVDRTRRSLAEFLGQAPNALFAFAPQVGATNALSGASPLAEALAIAMRQPSAPPAVWSVPINSWWDQTNKKLNGGKEPLPPFLLPGVESLMKKQRGE